MLYFPGSENHKQLSDFVRELLDVDLELINDLEDDVEKEYIKPRFPEILWAEDRDKCVKRFWELRARLVDDFLHETTELEWYILMRLHHEWTEVREDFEKEGTEPEDKARFKKELDLLYEIVDSFDGDCENVASLFALYKERSPLLLSRFGYNDLDEFMELMPRDILQEYLQLRTEREKGRQEPQPR